MDQTPKLVLLQQRPKRPRPKPKQAPGRAQQHASRPRRPRAPPGPTPLRRCAPREMSGAKPTMKKCRRGIGMRLTASLRRSELSWPGKRRQWVTPLMVSETLGEGKTEKVSIIQSGTPRGSWRWEACPCRTRCRRRGSGTPGSLPPMASEMEWVEWFRPDPSKCIADLLFSRQTEKAKKKKANQPCRQSQLVAEASAPICVVL